MKSIISAAAQIEPTKRNVISLVSRTYDPLGLISPVIVQFKVLSQKLCQAKLDWDEPFTEYLKERWKLLLAGLQRVGALKVSRLYTHGLRDGCRLVGFCDASLRAYAALVHIQDENYSCSLVASIACTLTNTCLYSYLKSDCVALYHNCTNTYVA